MRRRRPEKREILPDPVFNDLSVAKFVNYLMQGGKKGVAEKIVYDAIEKIKTKSKDEPINVFNEAINNIKPTVEVRSRRVGGATYQVPIEVPFERQQSLAFRWVVNAASSRKGTPIADALANELIDAYNNTGSVVKKREETHKMAQANRAFAHLRW